MKTNKKTNMPSHKSRVWQPIPATFPTQPYTAFLALATALWIGLSFISNCSSKNMSITSTQQQTLQFVEMNYFEYLKYIIILG